MLQKKMFLGCFLVMLLLLAAKVQAVIPPWEIEGLRGKNAPDFTIHDMEGKVTSPATTKGKVVLLNFWATWCGPCLEEMPVFERVYKKYKDKGLLIAGISIDTNKGYVTSFLKKVPVSFPIAVDTQSEVADRYKVFTYPSTFLIDKKGLVREIYLGARDWEKKEFIEKLEKMLQE